MMPFTTTEKKKGSALILVMTMVVLTSSLLFGLLTLSVYNGRKSEISIQKQILFFNAQSGLEHLKAIIEEKKVEQGANFTFVSDWADATDGDAQPYLTFRLVGDEYQFIDLLGGGAVNLNNTIKFFEINQGKNRAEIYLSIKKTAHPDWYRLESRAWSNGRETKIMTLTSQAFGGTPVTAFARFLSGGSLNPNSSKASYQGDLFVGGTLSHTTSGGKNSNRYFGKVTTKRWNPPTFNTDNAGGPFFFGNSENVHQPNTILEGSNKTIANGVEPENPVESLSNSIDQLGGSLPSDAQNLKFDYLANDSGSTSEKANQSSLWNSFSQISSGDVQLRNKNGDAVNFNSLDSDIKSALAPIAVNQEVIDGTQQVSNNDKVDTTIKFDVVDGKLKADIEVSYRTRVDIGPLSRITLKLPQQDVKNDTTFFTRGNTAVRGFNDRRVTVVATGVANVLGPVISVNSNGDKRFAVTQVDNDGVPFDTNGTIDFKDPISSSVRGKDWQGVEESGKRFQYQDKLEFNNESNTYWEPSQIDGKSVVPALALIAKDQILLRQPEEHTSDVPDFKKYAQNPEYHIAFVVANGEVHSHEDDDLNDNPIPSQPNSNSAFNAGLNLWPSTVAGGGNRNNFILYGTLVTRGGCLFHNKNKSSLIAYDESLRNATPPNVPLLKDITASVIFGTWAVLTNFRQNEDKLADFDVQVN